MAVLNLLHCHSIRPHRAKPGATRSTAGARSGKYAAQLGKEGFSNVRNMKGSLVSWVRSYYCPVGARHDGSISPPMRC